MTRMTAPAAPSMASPLLRRRTAGAADAGVWQVVRDHPPRVTEASRTVARDDAAAASRTGWPFGRRDRGRQATATTRPAPRPAEPLGDQRHRPALVKPAQRSIGGLGRRIRCRARGRRCVEGRPDSGRTGPIRNSIACARPWGSAEEPVAPAVVAMPRGGSHGRASARGAARAPPPADQVVSGSRGSRGRFTWARRAAFTAIENPSGRLAARPRRRALGQAVEAAVPPSRCRTAARRTRGNGPAAGQPDRSVVASGRTAIRTADPDLPRSASGSPASGGPGIATAELSRARVEIAAGSDARGPLSGRRTGRATAPAAAPGPVPPAAVRCARAPPPRAG